MRACPYCHVLFGPCVAPPKEHIRGHLEDRLKHARRITLETNRQFYRDVMAEMGKYGIDNLDVSVQWWP